MRDRTAISMQTRQIVNDFIIHMSAEQYNVPYIFLKMKGICGRSLIEWNVEVRSFNVTAPAQLKTRARALEASAAAAASAF